MHPGSLQPTAATQQFTLHQGDARGTAAFLADTLGGELLTTTVTSPPYAWLKNYGRDDQIGFGQDLDAYLRDCGTVFEAVAEHTHLNGSLWLIADTVVDQHATPSRLVPLPFLLAETASRYGWTLRDVITWQRDKGMPWSGRGRLRNAFEYVLHLVRSPDFKYNPSAARDASTAARWWVRFPERYHPAGPIATNVWDIPIPTQGSWAQTSSRHACPLPLELVDRIVRLSTDPGDIIFDPFAGIGSVIAQAAAANRRGLGLELDKAHVEAFPEFAASLNVAPARVPTDASVPTPALIMNLRALKRARVLAERLRHADRTLPHVSMASVQPEPPREQADGTWRANAPTAMLLEAPAAVRARAGRLLDTLAARAPVSKFGVDGSISVLSPTGFAKHLNLASDAWWFYPRGRTWRHERPLEPLRVADVRNLAATARKAPHVLAAVPIWLEE